ncbi:MAG TPA: hypothetical protein PLP83_04665 [Candidatus Aminicenantes bacterium]|nr:hypothetical protein [Candidatus Aminicenantes bacterium]
MPRRPSRLLPALLALAFVLGAGAALQAQITADDLNLLSWRWVGPVNFSGRISEIAVPPGQTTTYYLLAASGGVWKTEDAGTHFEPIFEKYGNMSMGSLAVAPSDPNILYLGTGEPFHARSSSHGNGVWKSTDAGKTWTNVGLTRSFFINRVQVDPKNPDVVYVAAEGKLYDNEPDCERGLYKTADGGKTWTNLGPVANRGVGEFAVDPRDFNVVIAQSCKMYRRTWTYIDRQPENWLYKTIDGGKTWKKLEGGLPNHLEVGRAGLAFFLKNPDIVYARIDEEVNLGLAERDGGANFRAAGQFGGMGFGAAAGVFAEGVNFDKFKAFRINAELAKQAPRFKPVAAADEAELVKALNERIADKDFLANSGVDLAKFNAAARKAYAGKKDLLAAIDEIEALQKREAPKADSSEAKGRIQATNRHVLEMLYGGVLRNQQPVKRSGVIYRSEDLGETWRAMTEYKHVGGSALVNQTEAGYYARIYVDPQNDQTLYAVDTNTTVSTDGGKTFKVTGWDSGAYKLHVDHRALWVDPANGQHIMSANDGGCGESWDGGKHWHQKSTVSAQQFYDVSADDELPYNIMGGTQDNGAWIGPSQTRNAWGVFAADWRYLPTGDAFYVVRDWWNPDWVYYEAQFGASSRQNLSTGEISPLAKRTTPDELAKGMPAQRYQWNAPIVLSPHNPGIVYICSQFVHRSLTRGEPGTFVTISPDLSRADKTRIEESKKTNLQYATIYTFAESAKKPGLYWAGTDDGNVQMSADGGVTWTNITANFYDMKTGKPKPGVKGALIPFDRWVKRVVPSRFDENTCYVGFSGYRTHNEDRTWLFVTRDLGKTWEDISGGLQNPIFDVEEDPDNPDVLYISGDLGIHVSVDRGKSWVAFSTSAPNVIVRDMAIQKRDRDMVIGTYGRGIYVADIAPLKEMNAAVLAKDAHLFDIEEAVRWNRYIQAGEQYGEFAKTLNPPVGTTIYYYLKAAPQSVKVVVKDLEGNLITEFAGAAKKGLQKADWNLMRRMDPQQAGPRPGGGFRGRGANLVDPGVYKVTLTVDGKDVATKTVKVSPDPLFK